MSDFFAGAYSSFLPNFGVISGFMGDEDAPWLHVPIQEPENGSPRCFLLPAEGANMKCDRNGEKRCYAIQGPNLFNSTAKEIEYNTWLVESKKADGTAASTSIERVSSGTRTAGKQVGTTARTSIERGTPSTGIAEKKETQLDN